MPSISGMQVSIDGSDLMPCLWWGDDNEEPPVWLVVDGSIGQLGAEGPVRVVFGEQALLGTGTIVSQAHQTHITGRFTDRRPVTDDRIMAVAERAAVVFAANGWVW